MKSVLKQAIETYGADHQLTVLLPCPFCGSEADFIGETATVKCKNCGGAFIVTNPLISRLEVAEVWNTRLER